MSKQFWAKCKRSICCGAPVIDAPDGLICSKEGCYKPVDHIVDANKMVPPTPSFYEPKEIEREIEIEIEKQPGSPVLDAYEPGLDAELFPKLHEPKTGQSEPFNGNLGMPERYRDSKNKGLL